MIKIAERIDFSINSIENKRDLYSELRKTELALRERTKEIESIKSQIEELEKSLNPISEELIKNTIKNILTKD